MQLSPCPAKNNKLKTIEEPTLKWVVLPMHCTKMNIDSLGNLPNQGFTEALI